MSAVLTKNALQILSERYFLKNDKGVIVETADLLFKRVTKYVATAELYNQTYWADSFYNTMLNLDFLPNSPTLMNAGLQNGQLSACFVLPVKDSLKSIFTTLKNAALIHQSGGGTGYNFSELRPKNDIVSSSGGKSTGPIAFMKIYDAATEHIKQGGKRRGANMGILNIDHPDIEEFIVSKSDRKQLQNFNISVGITDNFMNAVFNDHDWELINPRTKNISKKIKAKYLWGLIVTNAWETGDPGIIFLDTINKSNPTPKLGTISATNPCGEVPLLPYESCNLGSINLSNMIVIKNDNSTIDWSKLESTIRISIRFLDNIISINHYILPENETITKKNRKIGLGVMGWAEMLMKLHIPYASEKAIRLAKKLMKFIHGISYSESTLLAKEKGEFPEYKNSIHQEPMRNATCNSIAPTGTISVIANTSYSIEPLFALAFKRSGILNNITQVEINEVFVKGMKRLGLWNKEVKTHVLNTGSIQQINSIAPQIKEVYKTSLEIPWIYHLKHQQAFQKYTDNAVSKTINLPQTTSVKEISDIYKTAWHYLLKGITIYRYGSKDKQVLQRCNYNTLHECS